MIINIRRPTVASEADYTYTDKSRGRQLHFTPKSDEMMVTFEGTPNETTLNEVLQQEPPLLSVSQGYNLERGFAAVYVTPDQGMEAAIHSVEGRPEIANSLPVMIDQDGLTRYFLYAIPFEKAVSDRPLRCPVNPFAILLTHPKSRRHLGPAARIRFDTPNTIRV